MTGMIAAGVYVVTRNVDTLEESDYYEQSIHYDEIYTRKQNVENKQYAPNFKVTQDTLYITFKSPVNQGQLLFKRPSDGSQDITLPLYTNTAHYKLPVASFQKGRWNLSVFWTSEKIDFYSNVHLTF